MQFIDLIDSPAVSRVRVHVCACVCASAVNVISICCTTLYAVCASHTPNIKRCTASAKRACATNHVDMCVLCCVCVCGYPPPSDIARPTNTLSSRPCAH